MRRIILGEDRGGRRREYEQDGKWEMGKQK